jgi:hypothetical protein
MKKITLLFILFTSFIYAQQSTTQEEYNYMSKGYQISLSSGLDVKKGYRIENITTSDVSPYFFDFKAFVRDDNTLAGIILISTSKLWGNVYYSAIPINNDDLMTNFNKRLRDWDEDMVTAYSYASTALTLQLYKIYFDSSQIQTEKKN